jgi:hypothetical protein
MAGMMALHFLRTLKRLLEGDAIYPTRFPEGALADGDSLATDPESGLQIRLVYVRLPSGTAHITVDTCIPGRGLAAVDMAIAPEHFGRTDEEFEKLWVLPAMTILANMLRRAQPCQHSDASTEPHQCPYEADVHNDPSYLCRCCPQCTEACSREI